MSLTVHLARLRALERASLAWPTVLGNVTQSDVVNAITFTGGDRDEYYRLDVRYTYRIADRRYEGTRVAFRSRNLSKKAAAAAAAQFPKGAEVEVSYDPAAPGESVLQTGAAASDRFCMTALALYAGAAWTLFQALNRK